mmetsp:Transcript_91192/g.244177  ORF Transcript_91192/g.244177 Transcript_91192/m.244177 type:complete len:205 (+) Transcript_91192:955-1569(+)
MGPAARVVGIGGALHAPLSSPTDQLQDLHRRRHDHPVQPLHKQPPGGALPDGQPLLQHLGIRRLGREQVGDPLAVNLQERHRDLKLSGALVGVHKPENLIEGSGKYPRQRHQIPRRLLRVIPPRPESPGAENRVGLPGTGLAVGHNRAVVSLTYGGDDPPGHGVGLVLVGITCQHLIKPKLPGICGPAQAEGPAAGGRQAAGLG